MPKSIDEIKAELIEYISDNNTTQLLIQKLASIVEQEPTAINYYCMSDVYEFIVSGERKFEKQLTKDEEQIFMSAIQRDFPQDYEDFYDSIWCVANKMNLEIVDGVE